MNRTKCPFSLALSAALAFLPALGMAVPDVPPPDLPNPQVTPTGIATRQQALEALSGFLDYIVVVSGGKSTRPGGGMTREQVADALSAVVSYLSSDSDTDAGTRGASVPAKLSVEQATEVIKAAFDEKGLEYDLSFHNGSTPRFRLFWAPQEKWNGAIKRYKVDLVVDAQSIWSRASAVGVDTTPAMDRAAELAFRLNMHINWGFVAIDFNDGELYYDYRMPMEEFTALGENAPMVAMNVSLLGLRKAAPYFVKLLRGGETPKELDEQFTNEKDDE